MLAAIKRSNPLMLFGINVLVMSRKGESYLIDPLVKVNLVSPVEDDPPGDVIPGPDISSYAI
jgi:hypothetical protein